MKNFYKKGISLIEILAVIAILGIILVLAIPQFRNMREKQILSNSISDIISSLDKAKSQTLSSLNSFSYGVHFQSDKIIIFRGTTPGSDNENIDLVLPAIISNVTLNVTSINAGSDMGYFYFARLTGMPMKNLTTPLSSGTITVSTNSFSKIITISATGSASIN